MSLFAAAADDAHCVMHARKLDELENVATTKKVMLNDIEKLCVCVAHRACSNTLAHQGREMLELQFVCV